MKKIIAFNGSPRKNGNTSHMLQYFLNGANSIVSSAEMIHVHDINLKYCSGCLRCNVLGKCSISDDDWQNISAKILESDTIVFASPIYFHHVTAPLKKLIDRFRSFVHVQITETGLVHTPKEEWKKDFVLLLCMGSSENSDAQPVIELFNFMKSILGDMNRLQVITATRLAVSNQIIKTKEDLETLYPKLNLSSQLAEKDYEKNKKILSDCFELGKTLAS